MLKPNRNARVSVRIEQDLKDYLDKMALRKGMDLSKLINAVLTNYVKPNTYQL